MTRFVLLTGGLVLVGLLGFVIDAQSRIPVDRPAEPTGPQPIFAPGRIEGATPEIELRFRLAGRVDDLVVKEGQTVQKGAILARLDPAEYQHEVALAQAELDLSEAELERLLNGARAQERAEARALHDAKKAELERAQLTWERIRELRDSRAVSQQDADNQRTLVSSLTAELQAARARLELVEAPARPDEVAMAEARIDAAQARLELAEVQFDRTTLRAPTSGQILEVDAEPGELTSPDSPKPVIVLVDTTKYQVRAFVEEMDAPRLQVGMPATITADGLPDKLQGRITRLSPRMSPKSLWSDDPAERYDTKTREVWIELEDAEALVVGLRVDVVIDTNPSPPS
ncbi:MAG TPA: HlyD family efflux transporter periplasmic adaptor subunit [Thermoguttaceae bacterium]|nr:HlyD family efflux transporter periplasmic adaptor subunit [Thermoguttaceae bacterium]